MATATIYGSTTDGYLEREVVSIWSDARDAVSADSATAGADDLFIGWYRGPFDVKYTLFRSYLYFDTSTIPAAAAISAATLKVYLWYEDTVPTGHDIILYNGQPTYPTDPLAVADFNRLLYASGGASNITVWGGASGLLTFTLNSTGFNWITKEGTTKLCMRSEFDVTPTIPAAGMIAKFYATEKGGGYRPVLTVTYGLKATVTTDAATSLGSSYATANGTITDDGDGGFTDYGAIWNNDGSDPVDLAHADNHAHGSDLAAGVFTASMTGLSASSDYYYRVYVTNAGGTAYGSAVEFTTTAAPATLTVTTSDSVPISDTSMTLRGNIVGDGGKAVVEHGFIWKADSDPYEEADPIHNPTGADNYVLLGAGSEGAFTTGVASLDTGTAYLVRAFAVGGYQTTLRPDATGSETAITYSKSANHWADVDEEVADETTTYVYTASGVYLRDLYALPAAGLTGSIEKVIVYFRCKCYSGGKAKASLKSGATVADGDEETLTSSYQTFSYEWATNPDTSAPWEPSEIDDLEIGVSLKGVPGSYNADCTQVYALIEYIPPTGALQVEYGGIRICRTGTYTDTFYGLTGDGDITYEGQSLSSYADAETETEGAASGDSMDTADTSLEPYHSHHRAGAEYHCLITRGYVYFDTSSIPADATILSASLSLYCTFYYSSPTAFLSVYNGQPTHPTSTGTTGALELGDFDLSEYTFVSAEQNFGGDSDDAPSTVDIYYDVCTDKSIVTKAGLTKAMFYFENANGAAIFNSGNAADNKPKLTVTYTTEGDPPLLPQINVGGMMKNCKAALLRVGNQWRRVPAMQVNVGGTWKDLG